MAEPTVVAAFPYYRPGDPQDVDHLRWVDVSLDLDQWPDGVPDITDVLSAVVDLQAQGKAEYRQLHPGAA